MIHIQECPICHSNAFQSAFVCNDYSVSLEDFKIISCTKCNFLITSPRPSGSELSKYYSSTNYISHSNTSKGIINKLYHIVRKITLRSKIALIQNHYKAPRLLDIGSGAGYFINSCIQHGFEALGIEPDSNTRIRSIKQFNIKVNNEDELDKIPDSSFDVITLWHVLEHVEDLGRRINQINRLLTKEGIVIIALPNCSSYDAKHYTKYWAGFDVPRHLWHFTPETIQKLMTSYGFALFQTLPMYYDAYYVSMLSEKYQNSRVGVLKGIFYGFISNIKALLSNQNIYSSQIYLFRKIK